MSKAFKRFSNLSASVKKAATGGSSDSGSSSAADKEAKKKEKQLLKSAKSKKPSPLANQVQAQPSFVLPNGDAAGTDAGTDADADAEVSMSTARLRHISLDLGPASLGLLPESDDFDDLALAAVQQQQSELDLGSEEPAHVRRNDESDSQLGGGSVTILSPAPGPGILLSPSVTHDDPDLVKSPTLSRLPDMPALAMVHDGSMKPTTPPLASPSRLSPPPSSTPHDSAAASSELNLPALPASPMPPMPLTPAPAAEPSAPAPAPAYLHRSASNTSATAASSSSIARLASPPLSSSATVASRTTASSDVLTRLASPDLRNPPLSHPSASTLMSTSAPTLVDHPTAAGMYHHRDQELEADMDMEDDEFAAGPIDPAVLSQRILAEYCFNVAYVADWMNGDIPPPLGALESAHKLTSAAAEKPAKERKRRVPRIRLPGSKSSSAAAAAREAAAAAAASEERRSRSPSFANAVPFAPLKVGPLAQHVMDLFDWEPYEDYQPVDVRMFFLHLKALLESLTSLTSGARSSAGLAASTPPHFLLPDQFPSPDQLHVRVQHIIKAMRAEIALLADAHPELMQLSMEVISSNARLLGPVAPAASAGDSAASSSSSSDLNNADPLGLVGVGTAPRDWIRVLVPDAPFPLLQQLLAKIQVQVLAADDQLPMDRKSKALLDRVCQLWRVSPVTKDALLTEWVVDALQSQPVATLWPCLVNRMDKTTITVRRELRTMALDDQAAVRHLITAVVRQGKWYVSLASDDAVADLVHVLAVNKHLDAMIELMGLPATGQIVEAFAHGYTRRLLGLDAAAAADAGAAPVVVTDPAELMARLNHGAEQLPHFVASLPLPELQRNQIAFLLAHSFLMSASELCPIRLPDKEVREELTSVCYQHRRMRKVEDMMEDARAYLSEYAEEEMTLRRHSFTPDHLQHLEFLHELQLHLVSEKPEIEFIWDEWLLQLEDDLCDEVEVQIDEHLGMAAQAGAVSAAAATASDGEDMHRSRTGPTLEQLMDLLIKYLQYVQGFPFPNSHHVVRMIKALTRVFTRAITQGAQLSYRHILDGPHDRAALARGTLALQVRQLQHAREELGRVQRAVQAALNAIPDVSMDGYLAPFLGDEVMARIDVTEKPLGYALEVRADGELLLTVEPKARADSMAVPITHERTLELRLLAAADDLAVPAAEPVQESSATVVVTLQHADHWETLMAFEDSDMPVALQVQRDEQSYVKVYFQGCWDRITETIDSLMVVVADKVAQQILAIAKEYKKFLKTQARGGFLQQLQQSAANVVAPAQVAQVEASLTSLFDSVKNTLKRSNTQSGNSGSSSPTPGSSSISTSTSSPMTSAMLRSEEAALTRFRLAKMDDLNQYLAAVGKTIRDLEGPDRSGAALADQLRDGIWSTLSSRMAQHVLRNKAGDALKERPLPYVEWLQSVLIRCRDTLFPVDDQLPQPTDDEGTFTSAQRAPAPQSYLLVLLSRYAMDTDELQQEYLSNIMSYLDFKSQRIAEQARLEAEEAAVAGGHLPSPTRQQFAAMSLNRTPGMSPPNSPPPIVAGSMSLPRGGATTLRRAPTKVDPLLARITSDRQSVLFDKNLFKESPGTLQRRRTGGSTTPPVPAVPHYNLSAASGGSPGATRTFIAPNENTVTRRPGALARIQAAQNRPLSVLARPPTMISMHNGRYSIAPHPHMQPAHHHHQQSSNRRNTMLMREPSLKSVAGSIAPSDPLHYPLFAVLSLLRVRAESDPEIRAWLDEQKAVEQTIMTSMMQQEEEQRAAAAMSPPSSSAASRQASQDSYEPPSTASSPPLDGVPEEKDMMVGGSMIRVGTISRPKRPR